MSKPQQTEIPQEMQGETPPAGAATGPGRFGPPPEQVAKAAEAAKAARRFQDVADTLKEQASLAKDPAERENLWRAAYLKEKEAHGESKKARSKGNSTSYSTLCIMAMSRVTHTDSYHLLVMASGWGQGVGAGIGLSGAVGMGLGNLVGTLLSGVVAIPGSLIGAGVGALHGPWYSLQDMVTGKGGKNGAGDCEDGKLSKGTEGKSNGESETDSHQEDEAHRAIVEAARKLEDEEAAEKKGKDGGEIAGESKAT